MRKKDIAGGEFYKNSAGWLVIIAGTVTSVGIIAGALCWFLLYL
tara:strand:- start:73 stop:204 length:132 start_codon:yes stop_codon:yes gene_type:complete